MGVQFDIRFVLCAFISYNAPERDCQVMVPFGVTGFCG